MKYLSVISAALIGIFSTPANAETQLSLYGGYQTSPHSIVTGKYGDEDTFDFVAGWEGRSFAMPPYYGIRYTNWRNENWGISAEFTHSKVYADDETLDDTGFEILEFTDGINVFTLNAVRRFQKSGKWTQYIGGGAGFAIPHVEVQVAENAVKTFEYQYGGPALQLHGGVEYELNENWSAFAEYKFNYVMLDVDLDDTDDSYLKTDIVTNALNIGISYSY